MIEQHLEDKIKTHLGYPPTPDQGSMVQKLSRFAISRETDQLVLVKGYAGTGKTSVMAAMVKTFIECKIKFVLLAPTGRAAKVFSQYAGVPAYTIHKKIYRQKASTDGFGAFTLDRNLHRDTFFIVDEASMIHNSTLDASVFGSGRLLDDLLEYVYNDNRCKLILTGDTSQLPPVGLDISPALDKKNLEAYGLQVIHHELTEVVRQQMDSGILYNATLLRKQLAAGDEGYPRLAPGFPDIQKVMGEDLIEEISSAYSRYGLNETIIITRSNKRANMYNQGIRNQILFREEEIAPGDLLMVVKNNYFYTAPKEGLDFIANGDIAEILRVKKYRELYGFRFADVTLAFPDYNKMEIDAKIMLDTLMIGSAALPSDKNREFYHAVAEDYPEITSRKKKYEKIKKNPYFNALQVKFAYAVTCHKAQGGQWKAAFIDQGFLREDMLTTSYLRWLYTAFTRPVEKLYLVNFREEFFG